MKKYLIVVALLVSMTAGAKIVEKIVAKVNDEIITIYDISEKMKVIRGQYREQRKRLPADLRKAALDQMINDMLVMQKAKKDGVVVSRVEVEDRMSKMLKMQQLTLDAFKKKLQKEGQSFETVFSDMRKRLIVQKLFRKSYSKQGEGAKLKDEEIRAFYDKLLKTNPLQLSMYRIQHIYIYLNPGADFTTRLAVEKRITRAQAQVKRGLGFAWIARQNGARFKEFKDVKISPKLPKYLFPLFDKKMWVGKRKDFKIVTEIPGVPGYHAVKIVGIKPVSFEDVKGRIQQLLMEKKMADSMKDWVDALRKDARIIINS